MARDSGDAQATNQFAVMPEFRLAHISGALALSLTLCAMAKLLADAVSRCTGHGLHVPGCIGLSSSTIRISVNCVREKGDHSPSMCKRSSMAI